MREVPVPKMGLVPFQGHDDVVWMVLVVIEVAFKKRNRY